MKFIALLLLSLAGGLWAATVEETTAALVKKGHEQVTATAKAVDELHKSGHEHLLAAVQWQQNQVADLLGMLDNTRHPFEEPQLQTAQLALIDAGLAYTENRLAEELAIVREYVAHPKHETGTIKDLTTHAKELVVKAGAAIRADAAHQTHPSLEHSYAINDVNYEIRSIQTVVAQLEHKAAGADARKEIETLERNQISLNALLKRIGVNHAFF